jgi:hypothetical protein
MIADLAIALLAACFLAGCVVRLWRVASGRSSSRQGRDQLAASRLRSAVRRPALDVPVEGRDGQRPDDTDPLLPLTDR